MTLVYEMNHKSQCANENQMESKRERYFKIFGMPVIFQSQKTCKICSGECVWFDEKIFQLSAHGSVLSFRSFIHPRWGNSCAIMTHILYCMCIAYIRKALIPFSMIRETKPPLTEHGKTIVLNCFTTQHNTYTYVHGTWARGTFTVDLLLKIS